ncbi:MULTISPECIES: helix-turn-helix domain-containing protein [Rothia]|uniref:helix-turn-helix domain-containing protein n=1 Tax=Rothia TaxID=32207 RepID=UPI001F1BE2F3|nr:MULTISPECIES: helix-turn-helix transcriptional regulator [Rothia]WHS49640.1 helix-turn-helix transcriptional regulator [Rothia sp. SD9660Na]
MTTLEELKQMRPVDSHDLQRLVNDMHAEARVFQLQELRKDLGLTQTDLAEKIGVSQKRISQMEKGDIESVSIKTLHKYLAALGADLTVTADFPVGTRHKIYSTL